LYLSFFAPKNLDFSAHFSLFFALLFKVRRTRRRHSAGGAVQAADAVS